MTDTKVTRRTNKGFDYSTGRANLSFSLSSDINDGIAYDFLVLLKVAAQDVEAWIKEQNMDAYKNFTKQLLEKNKS
jgi:hypothetical protein